MVDTKEERARLERMVTGDLAQRYVEVRIKPIRRQNQAYLIWKIAWPAT